MVQSTRYEIWTEASRNSTRAEVAQQRASGIKHAHRAMCQKRFISALKNNLTTLTFARKISNEYVWDEHHKIAKIRFYVMACRYFTNKISTCYSSTSILSGNYFGRPANLIILNKISSL